MRPYPDETDNFFGLLVGSRRSGKTSLIKKLISSVNIWYNKFNEVHLWYPSPDKEYIKIGINVDRYYLDFNETEVEKIFERIYRISQKYRDYRALFIFDDMITEDGFKKIDKSHIINKLAIRGRHANVSVVIATQSFNGVSTDVRKNIDFVNLWSSLGDEASNIINNFHSGDKVGFKNFYLEHTKKPYSHILYNHINRTLWFFDPDTNKYGRYI